MQVRTAASFESWQAAARELLRAGVPPEQVRWAEGPAAEPDQTPPMESAFRVPRQFVELARAVGTHPAAERWSLLYRVLWRIVHEDHDLLRKERDPDVARLIALRLEAPPAGSSLPLFTAEPLPSAAPFVPAGASLAGLRSAAAGCTGCELYRAATQTVFGLGRETARVVMVGEQPGDQEDVQGAPFVGPAGQVLDRAMAEVGLSRPEVYVTNVVKHFKFVQRGKRRLHETPGDREVLACRPWLEAELALIRPAVLVCLGATAARAILGPWFRITRQRGQFLSTSHCARTLATFHPSAVLRAQEEADQERVYAALRDDLRAVAGALRAAG